MPEYSYTDDDRMVPIYCMGCRKHIPRKESDAGYGFCPSCNMRNLEKHESKMLINKQSEFKSEMLVNTKLIKKQSRIDDIKVVFAWILGVFVFLFWVGAQVQQNDAQVQQNDRLKREEREKYERETVIYKCEYCGEEFRSTQGKGKPHAYEISYCNAVTSRVHTLFEKKQD